MKRPHFIAVLAVLAAIGTLGPLGLVRFGVAASATEAEPGSAALTAAEHPKDEKEPLATKPAVLAESVTFVTAGSAPAAAQPSGPKPLAGTGKTELAVSGHPLSGGPYPESATPTKLVPTAAGPTWMDADEWSAGAVGYALHRDNAAAVSQTQPIEPPPLMPKALPEEVPAGVNDQHGPIGDSAVHCESCMQPTGCWDCRRIPTWIFGSEVTFLAPETNEGDVRVTLDDFVAPASQTFEVDDIGSMTAGPRFWLGVQGECWGVVGRYWRFGDSEASGDPFMPIPDVTETGYSSFNRLEAYTADVELTRAFCMHASKMYLAMGARYGLIEQDQGILAMGRINGDTVIGSSNARRSARGTGLTGAIGGRTPLFCKSCVHLFYNLRGSILWGPTDTTVETSSTVFNGDGSAASFNGAQVTADDDLFIGEVQVGVEWDYPLCWLPAKAFFRVAAEYQYWDASRGSAYSESFAEDVDVSDGYAFADSGGLQTDLIGFSLGAGFTW